LGTLNYTPERVPTAPATSDVKKSNCRAPRRGNREFARCRGRKKTRGPEVPTKPAVVLSQSTSRSCQPTHASVYSSHRMPSFADRSRNPSGKSMKHQVRRAKPAARSESSANKSALSSGGSVMCAGHSLESADWAMQSASRSTESPYRSPQPAVRSTNSPDRRSMHPAGSLTRLARSPKA
jgi:hypothetical protein